MDELLIPELYENEGKDVEVYDKENPLHIENAEKIEKILAWSLEQDDVKLNDSLPLKHYFTKGIYAREISIPKGMLVVGKIHKEEHFNFLLKGKVTVLTYAGTKTFTAPHLIVAKANTQKVVYAHEDTIWTSLAATDETDIEKIEEMIIDTEATQEQLLRNKKSIDINADIFSWTKEIN